MSGFKNFLQNFGDESQFWNFGILVHIDFKILEKICDVVRPYWDQILENFDFRILSRSQSYDKPPWRNFDFCQILILVKIENLKSLTLAQIQILVLNPKPKFAILANFGSLLNLVLPNLDRSRRQLSKNTKIVKFEQNLVPKFLISQILRVLGVRQNQFKWLRQTFLAKNLRRLKKFNIEIFDQCQEWIQIIK